MSNLKELAMQAQKARSGGERAAEQRRALGHLNKMMRSQHFDIMWVQHYASTVGVELRNNEAYSTLYFLNNCPWSLMSPELLAGIPGLIHECCGVMPSDLYSPYSLMSIWRSVNSKLLKLLRLKP